MNIVVVGIDLGKTSSSLAGLEAPELVVITDNCFCEYTDHGHYGVHRDGQIDNDATLANLGRQALVAVEAGADRAAGQQSSRADIIASSGLQEAPCYRDGIIRGVANGPYRACRWEVGRHFCPDLLLEREV